MLFNANVQLQSQYQRFTVALVTFLHMHVYFVELVAHANEVVSLVEFVVMLT